MHDVVMKIAKRWPSAGKDNYRKEEQPLWAASQPGTVQLQGYPIIVRLNPCRVGGVRN